MRKTLLLPFIPALLLSALSFQSCGSDEPDPDILWDILPIEFNIAVENTAGNSLLADSAFVADVTLTYKGETSAVIMTSSRAYMPYWEGAVLRTDKEGRRVITVGEFDGAGDYSDEFVLTIGGKPYSFSFSTKDKYKGDKVEFTRHYYLDGEKIPPYDNSRIVTYTIRQ